MVSVVKGCIPTMGTESWKNRSFRVLTLGKNVVGTSDRNCDIRRSVDIVPQIRDVTVTQCNEEIRNYTREVRVVVSKLRESLIETNEEVKALVRGKEALERTLEHTRKDLQLNKDSKFVRLTRPPAEKEHDGVDDLLEAEYAHLVNSKRSLEVQLKTAQQHLQCLDQSRQRTITCLQERSRVLDLICHALSAVLQPERDILNLKPNRSQVEGRTSMVDPGSLGSVKPDTLSPYTLEVHNVLTEATDLRNQSAYLRRDIRCTIDRIDTLKQTAHNKVNQGLTQKVAETVTLKQYLNLGLGETRHALHRAQRWYDATEKAHGYTLGPVCYSDLTTREHLDRPLVTVYQRHTGTQLPEAQVLVKAGTSLNQSLVTTSKNIGLLKIARKKLGEDKRSKRAAIEVDSSVIHMRRRKADHRWCLGTAF
ncbi:unnamed protein product [Candidula unifasciata]|uniref:Coiled-coil domain-containing protein 105 n=1 Tax=Candidula unifasciata TaxID=100452 RepID=A0A8S3YTP3_9EUPU|nr:unnamed protein product [Candidula unifasciata]